MSTLKSHGSVWSGFVYRAARVGSPHLPAELKGVLMLSHFMSREKGLFSFKLNFLDEEKISWLLNFFWYYILFLLPLLVFHNYLN